MTYQLCDKGSVAADLGVRSWWNCMQ